MTKYDEKRLVGIRKRTMEGLQKPIDWDEVADKVMKGLGKSFLIFIGIAFLLFCLFGEKGSITVITKDGGTGIGGPKSNQDKRRAEDLFLQDVGWKRNKSGDVIMTPRLENE